MGVPRAGGAGCTTGCCRDGCVGAGICATFCRGALETEPLADMLSDAAGEKPDATVLLGELE